MLVALALLSAICRCAQGYDSVCYGELGCFTDAPPWGDTQQRPFTILPDSPSNVKPRYYLDTRSQSDVEVYYHDAPFLAQTSFDSKKITRVIIHGWTDNGDVKWMNQMSDAFLAVEDVNVIRVGWFGGSAQINYMSSAVDTQIVGATTGIFIQNIIHTFGMTSDQFHCIGHSLGAHTCGYVGNRVNIERITGLDPAGPYFTETPEEVCLDYTDAPFVDVIHSDAERFLSDGNIMGLGTSQQSGNIDFWPNGGTDQPGCDQNIFSTIMGGEGITTGVRNFVACNHQRAVSFFTESIVSTTCLYKSFPCLSYDEFLQGKCLSCEGTDCPEQGYYANYYRDFVGNGEIKTYLSTNADKPYCAYMTEVGITLGSNSKSIDGLLYVTIYGESQATEQEALGGPDAEYTLQPGGYYSDLVYYKYNTGPISYVKVLWEEKEFDVLRDFITVERVTLFIGATQERLEFCGDTSIHMKEGNRYTINFC